MTAETRGPALWIRRWIVAFDRCLCRRMGLRELSDDPRCLFRGRVLEAAYPLLAADGRQTPSGIPSELSSEFSSEIPAGAPVLELHLTGERIPPLPADGPDVAWAVRGQRLLRRSCRQVALRLADDPELRDVRAVGGATLLFTSEHGPGKALFPRLGFTASPYRSPLGRFGEFWENVYTWLLMWAYNPTSLKHRRLLGSRRTEVWMTRERFLGRHGPKEAGPS